MIFFDPNTTIKLLISPIFAVEVGQGYCSSVH